MVITKQVNLAISTVTALVGVFVWWGAVNFDTDAGLFEGARLLPCIVGTGLIILAGVLLASGLGEEKTEKSSDAANEEDADDYGWRGLKTVAIPLTAIVLIYVGLLNGFGYLFATLLVAPAFFKLFGNQGTKHGLVIPIITAIVFYVLFFMVLGLFDPPGEILDFSEIFR
jgi:hypothetical protein